MVLPKVSLNATIKLQQAANIYYKAIFYKIALIWYYIVNIGVSSFLLLLQNTPPPFQVPLKSVKCPSLLIPPSMLFFFRDPQNLIVSRKRLKTRRKGFLKMIALFQNKKLRIFFIK